MTHHIDLRKLEKICGCGAQLFLSEEIMDPFPGESHSQKRREYENCKSCGYEHNIFCNFFEAENDAERYVQTPALAQSG